jgi:uncharacterized protein HemY
MLDNLMKMLDAGKESTLLRFSLGQEYLKREEWLAAAMHLRRAVELDPQYSAAWKLLGKALTGAGDHAQAEGVYQEGITVAERAGDKQAAKEMTVFLKRLRAADRTSDS